MALETGEARSSSQGVRSKERPEICVRKALAATEAIVREIRAVASDMLALSLRYLRAKARPGWPPDVRSDVVIDRHLGTGFRSPVYAMPTEESILGEVLLTKRWLHTAGRA